MCPPPWVTCNACLAGTKAKHDPGTLETCAPTFMQDVETRASCLHLWAWSPCFLPRSFRERSVCRRYMQKTQEMFEENHLTISFSDRRDCSLPGFKCFFEAYFWRWLVFHGSWHGFFKFKIRTNLIPLCKPSVTLPPSLPPALDWDLTPTCLAARLNHWAGRTRSGAPPHTPPSCAALISLPGSGLPSPPQIHRGCAPPSPRCTRMPWSLHALSHRVLWLSRAAPHPGQLASKTENRSTSCCNSSGLFRNGHVIPIEKGKSQRVGSNILLTKIAGKKLLRK